jgi:hypothetical protein|tara:strand:- start:76 stop:606 length:531 start_codon:yes stop_codon:yes gene_type:complete
MSKRNNLSTVKPIKKAKKSQASQVFIYILAIIVFSLVLLFGYKAIKGLITSSEKIDYVHFKAKLESAIKRVDYGDKLIEEFSIPSGFNEVCFISYEPGVETPSTTTTYDIIDDSWSSNVKANAFLVLSDEDITPFYIEQKMKATDGANNFYCAPVNKGQIELTIDGVKDYAQIGPP